MTVAVYENPIARDGDYADPFVLRHDGRYYLYSTTPQVDCWSSDDLLHWAPEGPTIAPDVFPGLVPFAPEVVYADGEFHMYTSPSGQGHHVLRSESPTGPFVDVSGNVGHAIDGNVLIDDDGRRYFYWAGDEGIWGCEMPSPTEFGEPVLTGIHMNGWTEGPFVAKRDGRYHMTLTGNHYLSAGYRIDAASSDHPLTGWSPGPLNPLVVSTDPEYTGLGHSCSIVGPDLVSTYLVFHNMNPDLTRHLNIDRQVWGGGRLLVLGPSREAPAPAEPTHRCAWNDGDAASWEVEGGMLAAGHRSAVLTGALDAAALWRIGAVPALTAEVSLTVLDAAEHGVMLETEDGRRIVVGIDRDAHRVHAIDGGEPVGNAPLPPGFAHAALHTWRIVADHDRIEVFLDGRRQPLELAPLDAPALVGVHARGGGVRIGHVALTDTTPDESDRRAVVPVPGRLWAALTPDAPSTQGESLALAAGESAGYRLHAARGGAFSLQLAGVFSAGDVIGVDAGGESTRVPVRHDGHVVTTEIRLTHGENPLRISAVAGRPVIELITVSPGLGDGDAGPVDGALSGYGKALLDPTPRADVDIEAALVFTATESGGHGDLLVRASALSEGGEGADTRLGVNFLLGYSVQLHVDRVVLARHDYDERILASAAADIDSEVPHRVVVRLRGERIAVELDGVPIIDVADVLPHATGATGIRAAGGNLRVEGLVVRGIAHT
ncbi:family 43 glycosylhydrolase [Microbacterium sp. LWH10-1.2]|uniref:family 43 glycosylhydrolase n=1 Tax=Microbacterium sp. LWH10-1.2 TaxID=3135255 RepID=UPI00313998DA